MINMVKKELKFNDIHQKRILDKKMPEVIRKSKQIMDPETGRLTTRAKIRVREEEREAFSKQHNLFDVHDFV
jgi:hypothetical protein